MMRTALLYPLLAFLLLSGCGNINRKVGYRGERETFDHRKAEAARAFDRGDYRGALEIAESAHAMRSDDRELNLTLAHAHMAVIGMDPAGIISYIEDLKKKTTSSSEDPTFDRLLKNIEGFRHAIELSDDVIAAMSQPTNADGTIPGQSTHPLFIGLDLRIPRDLPEARKGEQRYLAHIQRSIELVCPYVDPSVRIIKDMGHTVQDSRHAQPNCSSAHDPDKEGDYHYLWVAAHFIEATILTRYIAPNFDVLVKRFEALGEARHQIKRDEVLPLLRESLAFVNAIYPADDGRVADSIVSAMINDVIAGIEGYREVLGVSPEARGNIATFIDKVKMQSTPFGTDLASMEAAVLKSIFKALANFYGPDLAVAERRRNCRLIADAFPSIDEDRCVTDFYTFEMSDF